MKKKIAFLSPETKGWPYYIYKDIVDWLNQRYQDKLDVYFYNSKKDWLKLHFARFDYVFSVIPFLFKPLSTKKFIYNPRWNFEIEKKNKSLWNKLLYLARNNLRFANNIALTSYFLADKLYFRKKYEDKIIIIPNFIDKNEYNFWKKVFDKSKYNILTITSFKFYNKWRWIINLWKVISELWKKTNKQINWTIVGNDDWENFKTIKKEFDKVSFSNNIDIIWKWWLSKENIKKELKNNDYFIYWTYLDNFPNILLEAIACNMKVLVNNFESFPYFLSEEIICKNENEMVDKLISDNIKTQNIENYTKEKVLEKIYKIII